MKHPAVFMDRDGTLIEDTGYVRRPEDVRLLEGADEAVRRLNDAGFKTVLVTNQSGVARGLMTLKDVAAVNDRLIALLGQAGARIDGIYFCPHLPDGNIPEYARDCSCRKPKPGLILRAAEEMEIDLAASYLVGDSPRDVEAGQAAGCKTLLIDRGVPIGNINWGIVVDMREAAERILTDSGRDLPPVTPAEAEFTPEPDESGDPDEPREPDFEPESGHEPPTQPDRSLLTELPWAAKAAPVLEEPRPQPKVQPEPELDPEPEPEPPEPPKPAPRAAAAKPVPEPPVENPRPKPAPAKPPSSSLTDCAQCGAMIPDSDLAGGRAREVDGRVLCRDCFIYYQARTTQPRPVSNADLLTELKNISRSLIYEKFSVFNIFGGLAQAGVFAAMLYAGLSGNTQEGLLWAIALQLLALTMFILGRQ